MSSPRHATLSAKARRLGIAALIAVVASGFVTMARAEIVAPPSERELQSRNPALYGTAREFFPSDDGERSARRVFRLTRDQIDASVASLLPGLATRSVKTALPRDPLQTNYEYADMLTFNAANARGYMDWVREISANARKAPGKIIDCKADGKGDCIDGAVRRFLVRAFRGSGDDGEIVRIAGEIAKITGGAAEQAGVLVELALTSPEFLFRKEVHSERRGRMAAPQLLQALTYMIADAPPEALGLAADEALRHVQTPFDRHATTESVLASTFAREKLVRFFKAWLEIKEPSEFRVSKQVFPEFTEQLAAAMVDESERLLRHVLSKPEPRLSDITLATATFPTKPLEGIYKNKIVDPSGAKAIDLDKAQRLGIFTHPAVLASQSGTTSSAPIKRGVFWTRKVMCIDMDAPPKTVDTTVYEIAGKTERERIEAVTKGPTCIGCHKVIDPLGFFQESYDALGRFRDKDEDGHPIDASATFGFLGGGERKTTSSVEALRLLTSSDQFKQCFVRQAFRFYMGRKEEPSDDAVLRAMFIEFAHEDRRDIVGLLRALVSSSQVRLRPVETGTAKE